MKELAKKAGIELCAFSECLHNDTKDIIAKNHTMIAVVTRHKRIQPKSETEYDFKYVDEVIKYAEDSDLKVRIHLLFWQNGVPDWLLNDLCSLNSNQIIDKILKFVSVFVNRYKGKIACYDVVGELNRKWSFWNHVNEKDLVSKLFITIKNLDPKATLIYNECNFEDSCYWAKVYGKVKWYVDNKIPIDEITGQLHFHRSQGIKITADVINNFRNQLKMFARLGLRVGFGEVDVALPYGINEYSAWEQYQAWIYKSLIDIGLSMPEFDIFGIQGEFDKYSWFDWNVFPGVQCYGGILDYNNHPKLAYFAIRNSLKYYRPIVPDNWDIPSRVYVDFEQKIHEIIQQKLDEYLNRYRNDRLTLQHQLSQYSGKSLDYFVNFWKHVDTLLHQKDILKAYTRAKELAGFIGEKIIIDN